MENQQIKIKSKILVTCNCGCGGGYEIKTLDGMVFISLLNSDFYTYQTSLKIRLDDKIKDLVSLIRHKKIYMKEIFLTKDELEKLLEEMKSLSFENDETEVYDNMARLKLEALALGNEILYSLSAVTTKNFKKRYILLNKKYYGCEIAMTKNEWQRFVEQCEKYYKYTLKEFDKMKENKK